METTDTPSAAGVDESVVDPSAQVAASDQETPTEGDETPVSPATEEETPTAPDEDEESPEDEANLADLDDETVDALAEVYGDRFLKSKALQDRISQAIQRQVEKQVTERQRTYESQDTVERIIAQGKQAVDGLTRLAEAASSELDKASRGEEVSATAFDPGQFSQHLRDYGQAIVAEVSTRYDRAFQDSIEDALANRLPALTEAQVGELVEISSQATRMGNDPRQAAQAKPYFVSSMMQFLLARAAEAGAVMERERAGKKSTVAKKIADANVVKAAQAKLAAQKGNPPPKSPTSTPVAKPASGAYDSEVYRRLKREDPQKAQEYVDRFGTRRTPALV